MSPPGIPPGVFSALLSRILPVLVLLASATAASAQQDDPGGRWEFFVEQRRSPGVPGWGARLQVARESVLRRPVLRLPPGGAAARVGASDAWEPLGPEIIESYTISTGRVSAVVLHPADVDVIFAGGAQGGVWRTEDAGVSWRPLTDRECSLAMGALALDPVDPDIVYAGTGEQHFSADSYYGCGILRSSDGGESWTRLGEGVFTGPMGGTTISRIVVDSATAGTLDATTVYAATADGLFISTDSGSGWTKVLDGVVTDVLVYAGDREVLFAALAEGEEKTGHATLHRSGDGGLTWQEVDPGLGVLPWRAQLAQSPSSPEILYLSAGETGGVVMARSSDGGDSWTRASAEGVRCGQCWYNQSLAVHPTDPDVVYFGAVLLYRSVDGGETFSTIGRVDIHVDQHVLTVDARAPDMLLVGNDGGVYRSPDRGDTWKSLNTNLSLTQFYAGVSIHPRAEAISVLAGTQDNGTVQGDGDLSWPQVMGGDGGFTALDPRFDRRWAETQWRGGTGGPRRSDDGGSFRFRGYGIDLGDDALFIPPLVMDPFDPDVLYFGTERLYRTVDGGERWELVAEAPGGKISAIAPSRSDARVVYFATSESDVVVTRDGGGSWRTVSGSLPMRYVSDIAVHPHDPATAYAVFSGFGTGHVFVTRDYGTTWTDITGDLPDHPVNAVLLDPSELSRIYIGTDLGVFSSQAGGSWARLGEGLPMVAVFDLAVEPAAGVMVAATHGRGAFALPMAAPLVAETRGVERRVVVARQGDRVEGGAPVRIYGTGWPDARWTAAGARAGWIELTRAEGGALDSIGWRIDPGDLAPGEYVDTVTVVVAGAGVGVAPGSGRAFGGEGTFSGAAGSRALGGRSGARAGFAGDRVYREGGGPGAGPGWPGGVGGLAAAGSARPRAAFSGGLAPAGFAGGGPGAAAGSAVLPIRLVVRAVNTLAFPSEGRYTEVQVGATESVADSAQVAVAGPAPAQVAWRATHGGSAWLELVDSAGTGPGQVRWTRRVDGLAAGLYLDTIRVAGEGPYVRPATLVDSLRVAAATTVTVAGRGGAAATLAGVTEPLVDTLVVEVGGYGSRTATWTAEHGGSPWLELVVARGAAGGGVVVRRTPGDLGPGTYVDTIRIRVEGGATPRSVVVVDSLLVGEDLPVEAAISAVFGEHDLDEVQALALDRLGNRDCTYDLGDALSWVARCGRGGAGCGAISGGTPALLPPGGLSHPVLPATVRALPPTVWTLPPTVRALPSTVPTLPPTVRARRPGHRRRYDARGFIPPSTPSHRFPVLDVHRRSTGARRKRYRSTRRLQNPYTSTKHLRFRYRTQYRLMLLLAASLALGCGGDDVVEPPVATSAVVVPAGVNLVALQESLRLQATIHDQNGQVMPGAPVTWSTSDSAVVTVDPIGTAVSVGNGRAQVTAASGNATAAASVVVAQRGAVVEVAWGGPRLLLGDSVQATLPVANDPNGHRIAPARITWTTSDPAVATIDPEGWVHTVGPGQARIEVDVGGFLSGQEYSVELEPGYLEVALILPPGARDLGAHLSIEGPIGIPGVEGPAIDSVRAADYELYRSRATSPTQVIIAGPLASGPVLEFRVPHVRFRAQYRVHLLQVAGDDYALKELTGYSALISP